MTITLYDIPSTIPGIAWSPNTWKIRFALNYKGLTYKTEWVEFPDIEPQSKKLGIKPTGKKSWDGSDYYSLPAIYDPSTGIYIADSVAIAKYLDITYPDTPSLFPGNTHGLQIAFTDAFSSRIMPVYALIGPNVFPRISARCQEHIRISQEKAFGVKMEDIIPTGENAVQAWEKFKNSLQEVDGWFAETDHSGPFIMGDVISWGDIIAGSYLIWMKLVYGDKSQQWNEISSWNGGRWANLLQSLDKYTARN